MLESNQMHDLQHISRSRRLYLQILELGQHFSFAAKLHFGERWIWIFISFSGKQAVTTHSWRRAQHMHPRSQQGGQGHLHLFCPLQPLRTVKRSWCSWGWRQRRGPRYRGCISFSLKCLKVGMGCWWGPFGCPRRPRQAKSQQPCTARWPGKPSTRSGQTAKSMCFLPRHGPLSGADGPHPRTPALIPATESKTFHLAEPGAGDPKQMPSVDIRPYGLKGSQGKHPPKLEGGGMAATHSTKCWHLHPQPGRLLTGS